MSLSTDKVPISDYGYSKVLTLIEKYPESEYLIKLRDNFHIFIELYTNCKALFDKKSHCGSYLICKYNWPSYEYVDYNYLKQQLLYDSVKDKKNILEIGVFMCHSILIMLLSNPTLKITAVDIDPNYCKLCMPVIRKYFPDAEINLIFCDSLTFLNIVRTVRRDIIWDMAHVDGAHFIDYVKNEYELLKEHIKSVVFDDIKWDIELFLQFGRSALSYKVSNTDIRYSNMYIQLTN